MNQESRLNKDKLNLIFMYECRLHISKLVNLVVKSCKLKYEFMVFKFGRKKIEFASVVTWVKTFEEKKVWVP